jgi:hypothetical protein
MHPDVTEETMAGFQIARARQVLALSTLRYSTDHMPAFSTSLPHVHIANSAQIPNGTLNVNETLGVVERALPHLDAAFQADRGA